MNVNCPLCGSSVAEEKGPVVLADDGLPTAVSVAHGLPVPYAEYVSGIEVFLDGEAQTGVVAFDRAAGAIWRHVEVSGIPLRRGDEFVIERVEGAVTIAGSKK